MVKTRTALLFHQQDRRHLDEFQGKFTDFEYFLFSNEDYIYIIDNFIKNRQKRERNLLVSIIPLIKEHQHIRFDIQKTDYFLKLTSHRQYLIHTCITTVITSKTFSSHKM